VPHEASPERCAPPSPEPRLVSASLEPKLGALVALLPVEHPRDPNDVVKPRTRRAALTTTIDLHREDMPHPA